MKTFAVKPKEPTILQEKAYHELNGIDLLLYNVQWRLSAQWFGKYAYFERNGRSPRHTLYQVPLTSDD